MANGSSPNRRMGPKGSQQTKNNRIDAAHLVQRFDDHESNQIKSGIREVLLRLEPLVKVSAGNAPIGSMIGFLEEVDDSSFEKYLLVRHMKSKLRSSLFDLVQSEVQLQCRDTQLTPEKMKIVAPAILSKLVTSPEMEECMSSLQEEVGDAAMEMCTNFDRELVLMSQLRDSPQRPHSRNSSGLSDSLSSTWNQSGFIFIQPNQYAKIADKLNPYRASEDRIEALNTLLLSQIGECLSVQSWPAIKDGLQAALLDNNAGISCLALRLYGKMLTNISPHCTKEAFSSMVSTIISLYKDRTRNYQLPAISAELSFKKRSNHNLLQTCRLITATCREMPKYWTRYPPIIVEQIMQNMLDLITLKSKGQKTLSPIHLISLVDPKAKWLKAWLHGNLGKQMFFQLAQETMDNLFFKTAIHHLLLSLEKNNFPLMSRSSGRKKGLISHAFVSFAFFSHNLHTISLALPCKTFQGLFPVNLPGRPQKLDDVTIVKGLVTFVCQASSVSQATPAKIITQVLVQKICATNANVQRFLLHSDVIEMMVNPLLSLSQSSQNQHPAKILNICRFLVAIFNSPSGKVYASTVHIETGCNLNLPDFILNLTSRLMKNLNALSQHQNDQVLLMALEICSKIGQDHLFVITPKYTEFIQVLSETLAEIEEISSTTPTNSMANINLESHAWELKEKIFEVLEAISQTPAGLESIVKQNDLWQLLVQEEKWTPFQKAMALASPNCQIFGLNDSFHQDLFKSPDLNQNLSNLVMTLSNVSTSIPSQLYKSHLEDWLPRESDFACGLQGGQELLRLEIFLVLINDLNVRSLILGNYVMDKILNGLLETFRMEDGTLSQDETSLCIKYILESLKGIGGFSERRVIKFNGTETEEQTVFDHKFMESSEFLSLIKSDFDNEAWINRAQNLFEKYLHSPGIIKPEILCNFLIKIIEKTENLPIARDKIVHTTHPEVFTQAVVENLATMLEKYAIKQNVDIPSRIFIESLNDQTMIDWMKMSALILTNGNLAKAHLICQKLDLGDLHLIGHLTERIMVEEMPGVLTKLRHHNISPAWIVKCWLNQSFLNILEFCDIIHFLILISLHSPHYCIYVVLSLFCHLKSKILSLDNEKDLLLVLKCDPIPNFRFNEYITYIHVLEQKYAKIVVQ